MLFGILFWFIILLIIYSFVGYPIILFLISLFIKKNQSVSENFSPKVSLLISAYNEESVIKEKIENSLSLNYSDLEIIVISDGSTDNTVDICNSFQNKIKLVHFEKNLGKNAALNNVLNTINSEIIVFSDANSIYDKNSIVDLVKHFSNDKIGCVNGRLKLISDESQIGKGESIYWNYEHILKLLESKFGRLISANGAIFSVRKKLLNDLHNDIPNDFFVPIDILTQGYNVIYEPEAVAYENTSTDASIEYKRKVRIINRSFQLFKRYNQKLNGFLKFEFYSHKLIRWLIGVFAIIELLLCALLISDKMYFIFFILQICFYICGFIGAFLETKTKIFGTPYYISLIILSSLNALWDVFTGKKYSRWSNLRK